MSVGVMKDSKLKLRNLHVSDTGLLGVLLVKKCNSANTDAATAVASPPHIGSYTPSV
jgi:hypothetical protein